MTYFYSADEYLLIEKKEKNGRLVFYISLTLVISVLIILLLLRDDDNHTLFLIISCVLSVLFTWFCMGYFSVYLIPLRRKKINLYQFLKNDMVEIKGTFLSIDENLTTVNNICCKSILLLIDGTNEKQPYEKVIFVDKEISFTCPQKGTRVCLYTVDNILVAMDKEEI